MMELGMNMIHIPAGKVFLIQWGFNHMTGGVSVYLDGINLKRNVV